MVQMLSKELYLVLLALLLCLAFPSCKITISGTNYILELVSILGLLKTSRWLTTLRFHILNWLRDGARCCCDLWTFHEIEVAMQYLKLYLLFQTQKCLYLSLRFAKGDCLIIINDCSNDMMCKTKLKQNKTWMVHICLRLTCFLTNISLELQRLTSYICS